MGDRRDPWDLDPVAEPAQQPQAGRPREIRMNPRQPTPQTPLQNSLDQSRLTTDQLTQEKLRRELQQPAGMTPEQVGALRRSQSNLPTLERGIGEIADVYRRSFQGNPIAPVLGYLPSMVRPDNGLLNDASQRLPAFIADALSLSGQQFNTPAEQQLFIQSYLPSSTDTPQQIEAKVQALTDLVNNARRNGTQRLGGEYQPFTNPLSPSPQGPTIDLSGQSQAPNTGLALQQNRRAGADEDVVFGDQAPPPRGARLSPQQEAQIASAIRSGDQGQALALLERYTGAAPGPDTIAGVAAVIADVRRDPNTPIQFGYGAGDQQAIQADEAQRFGNFLPRALEDRRGSRVDPFVRGAADTGSFGLADELQAGVNTLPLIGNGQSYTENWQQQQAIDEADQRLNGGYRFAGQMGGALVNPVTRTLGRTTPLTSPLQMARTGAIEGSLYGYGSSQADPNLLNIGNRLPNAVEGGGAGATIGGGLGALLRAGRSVLPRTPTPDQRLLAQAAQQEGVPIGTPVIDPTRRDLMAYLESSPGSGTPIRDSLDATRTGIQGRVNQIGQGGTALDSLGMGTRVQNAMRSYIANSRTAANRLYDRASNLAGNNTITPTRAIDTLAQEIAQLSGNPNSNAAEIRFLNEIMADLTDAAGNPIPKTVAELRDLRTGLRGRIGQNGLTFSQVEGRTLRALDSASEDIANGLSNTAPDALRAYQAADEFYRGRQQEITQVAQRVLGGSRNTPLSPERAWENVLGMASNRGDAQTLNRLWGNLSPEDQIDAAATITENLARRSAEDAFSPGYFLQRTNNLSREARGVIFGPEGARSISNLRRLSRELINTESRLNNSRSGVVNQWGTFLRNLVSPAGGTALGAFLGGPVGAAVGGAITAGAGIGARRWTARMLMNPNITRWAAQAPRHTTARSIRNHIARLGSIAARETAVAGRTNPVSRGEIQEFYNELSQQFGTEEPR